MGGRSRSGRAPGWGWNEAKRNGRWSRQRAESVIGSSKYTDRSERSSARVAAVPVARRRCQPPRVRLAGTRPPLTPAAALSEESVSGAAERRCVLGGV